jgi:hypothetical protein
MVEVGFVQFGDASVVDEVDSQYVLVAVQIIAKEGANDSA